MSTDEDSTIVFEMPSAVEAFDRVAPVFDQRFSGWLSVGAQRAAVRRCLLAAFPRQSHLLELGGGTAEDAIFLAHHGRRVLMTDGSPTMVARAKEKILIEGLAEQVNVRQLAIEQLPAFAAENPVRLDGVFSNFASLNCLPDLTPIARPLARLLPPGARALFVMFGKWSVGELALQLLKRQPRVAIRRFSNGPVAARVGEKAFHVWYPSVGTVKRALLPWFRLVRTRGIGVFVPPSAAEPAISRFPRLVRVLAAVDRVASVPLSRVADHVLFEFVRTDVPLAD